MLTTLELKYYYTTTQLSYLISACPVCPMNPSRYRLLLPEVATVSSLLYSVRFCLSFATVSGLWQQYSGAGYGAHTKIQNYALRLLYSLRRTTMCSLFGVLQTCCPWRQLFAKHRHNDAWSKHLDLTMNS